MSGVGTLDGHTIRAATVHVPAWGCAWADIELVEPVVVTGTVPLVIADTTRTMTIVSGGVAEGRAAYRAVSGRGGWGRTIAARSYLDDAGVQARLVLEDAARECGETLVGAPTTRLLGPQYARAEDAAMMVLHTIAPRGWYVADDGSTVVGLRPTTTYRGDGVRTRTDPATGVVEIESDDIATLVPGVVVDDGRPATDVEIVLSASKLLVRVYQGPTVSRRLVAWSRLLDALDPHRRYRGCTEYRVVTQVGERLNLQPAIVGSGMPELRRVPVRPGMAGMRAQVMLGSLVIVQFIDADPSRPIVTHHDAPDSPGFMPIFLDFGVTPRLGVARQTDPVVAGPFAGTIVTGSARIRSGI